MTSLGRALLHLRLPFSVVLTPLFLWGAYLAGPRPAGRWPGLLTAYMVVHIFLYGGMNAFNSFWDRDEGPIGALADPPPVDRTVLWLSLLCKGAALAGGFWVSSRFGALVSLAVLLSVLYSHGRWRWKERPALAAATIFVGQGLLGVLWGFVAAGGSFWPAGWSEAVGVLGAALFTTGFYPLTGVYQIESDAERGMNTLAVRLGIGGCFAFAAALALPGGAGIGLLLLWRGQWIALTASGLYLAVALWRAVQWQRRIQGSSARQNQRELMGQAYANGVFFSALFLCLLLFGG